jgi:hypothetical protein
VFTLFYAEYLDGNGALSKLIFGGDGQVLNEEDSVVPALPATLEVGMTEADSKNKNLIFRGGLLFCKEFLPQQTSGGGSTWYKPVASRHNNSASAQVGGTGGGQGCVGAALPATAAGNPKTSQKKAPWQVA